MRFSIRVIGAPG